jgi:hypothetical protein
LTDEKYDILLMLMTRDIVYHLRWDGCEEQKNEEQNNDLLPS